VSCWGRNDFGVCGDAGVNHRRSPVSVEGLNQAEEVVIGALHACARRSDGSVWCWGSDLFNTMARQRASSLRTFGELRLADRP
jgi:alpha-tubulin suppressor-like RCC1 family protein